MKKYISLAICAVIIICSLAACGKSPANPEDGAEKLKIVTTIFPVYDWVKNILGDKAASADVTLLLDSGVDLHSYQPTADDIVKISACDVFIYVGGESDEWVEDALAGSGNTGAIAVNLIDELGAGAKSEEIKEGMEEEEAEEEGEEKDEHIWLSLKNAAALCNAICDKICQADSDNENLYKENTASYIEKIKTLDNEYQSAVSAAKVKTVVFGDRFPFRYLVDDYGLDYYAAFVGCSAESEASFKTVVFLAGKLDELGLKYVLQIESADGRLAQSVIDASADKGREILTLNSMQSTTASDIENGADYLSIMESNLGVLKTAIEA